MILILMVDFGERMSSVNQLNLRHLRSIEPQNPLESGFF